MYKACNLEVLKYAPYMYLLTSLNNWEIYVLGFVKFHLVLSFHLLLWIWCLCIGMLVIKVGLRKFPSFWCSFQVYLCRSIISFRFAVPSFFKLHCKVNKRHWTEAEIALQSELNLFYYIALNWSCKVDYVALQMNYSSERELPIAKF